MKQTRYLAGINTTPLAGAVIGKPILISYADVVRRPGWWRDEMLPLLQRKSYPQVMLDSGAFTELGDPSFHVDLGAFRNFALAHQDLFTAIVTLDDIQGDVERSRANTQALEDAGLSVMPVYHQGEPWEVLEALVERYDYIGIGCQRPMRGVKGFLAEVFKRTANRARIHGLGLTRYADDFPFYTVDSTTWIAERRALNAPSWAPTRTEAVDDLLARLISLKQPEADLDEGLSMEQVHQIASEGHQLVADEARRARVEGWAPGNWIAPLEASIAATRGQAGTLLRRIGAPALAGLLHLAHLETGACHDELVEALGWPA